MPSTWTQKVIPGCLTAAVASVALFPIQPAAAVPDLLRDIGIGAGTNVVTGGLSRDGSTVGNVVGGAATGAAVHSTRRATGARRNRNSTGGLARDAAVGAAANTVTGEITNNGSTVGNIVRGAATGVLINILD